MENEIDKNDPNKNFKGITWSTQDVLSHYNLDHLEKILSTLNKYEIERFIEEMKFKVYNNILI